MKQDNSYLLHLLGSVINNTQPDNKPESVSWKELFNMSKLHSVAGMTFYAIEKLKTKPDPRIMEFWGKIRDQEIARDIIQQNDYYNLTKAFEDNNIRYIPLKGSLIKKLYPRTDMRFMSDIDILIDEKNMKKAGEVITRELGFECETHDKFCHDTFHKAPISNIELHRELFSDTDKEHEIFSTYFSNVFDHCNIKESNTLRYDMPVEYLYTYIIAHMNKHYEGGGCGIRSFVDIYVLSKTLYKECDRRLLSKCLSDTGLESFEKHIRELSHAWFSGNKIPEYLCEMENFVMGSSTYGSIEMQMKNQAKRHGKLKTFLSQMFKPYRFMKVMYPILKVCPILLPVLWIWRLLYAIVMKRKKVVLKIRSILK